MTALIRISIGVPTSRPWMVDSERNTSSWSSGWTRSRPDRPTVSAIDRSNIRSADGLPQTMFPVGSTMTMASGRCRKASTTASGLSMGQLGAGATFNSGAAECGASRPSRLSPALGRTSSSKIRTLLHVADLLFCRSIDAEGLVAIALRDGRFPTLKGCAGLPDTGRAPCSGGKRRVPPVRRASGRGGEPSGVPADSRGIGSRRAARSRL